MELSETIFVEDEEIRLLEELELFLCNLGLRDDLYDKFLSKGIYSIDKLKKLEIIKIDKSVITDDKQQLINLNILLVDEKIKFYYDNKFEYIDFIKKFRKSILENMTYELHGINATKETFMNSFKLKKKPNNYLPKDFKINNFTADKLYASFLQDRKIGFVEQTKCFVNLRHLYLNNNKLQKIENMNFPNLKILELSNNFIKKIENLDMCSKLETLNLEKNLICRLENLKENILLECLNIRKQVLTQFQRFEIVCDSLYSSNIVSSLQLDYCNIYNPSDLIFFKKLKILRLNNNKIFESAHLINALNNLTELETLSISNNPFIDENKSVRDIIVLNCPNLQDLDGKTVSNNEKLYINSLYYRKFRNKVEINKKIENSKNQSNSQLNINVNKINISKK